MTREAMNFVLMGLKDIKNGVTTLGCRKVDGSVESDAIQNAVMEFTVTYERLLDQLGLAETTSIGDIVFRPCSICGAPVPHCECP